MVTLTPELLNRGGEDSVMSGLLDGLIGLPQGISMESVLLYMMDRYHDTSCFFLQQPNNWSHATYLKIVDNNDICFTPWGENREIELSFLGRTSITNYLTFNIPSINIVDDGYYSIYWLGGETIYSSLELLTIDPKITNKLINDVEQSKFVNQIFDDLGDDIYQLGAIQIVMYYRTRQLSFSNIDLEQLSFDDEQWYELGSYIDVRILVNYIVHSGRFDIDEKTKLLLNIVLSGIPTDEELASSDLHLMKDNPELMSEFRKRPPSYKFIRDNFLGDLSTMKRKPLTSMGYSQEEIFNMTTLESVKRDVFIFENDWHYWDTKSILNTTKWAISVGYQLLPRSFITNAYDLNNKEVSVLLLNHLFDNSLYNMINESTTYFRITLAKDNSYVPDDIVELLKQQPKYWVEALLFETTIEPEVWFPNSKSIFEIIDHFGFEGSDVAKLIKRIV